MKYKDITEQINTLKKLQDQQTCAGLIMIDNYDEMIELLPDDKKALILAEVEKKIFDWVYKHNGAAIDKMPVDDFINLSGHPVFEKLQKVGENSDNV